MNSMKHVQIIKVFAIDRREIKFTILEKKSSLRMIEISRRHVCFYAKCFNILDPRSKILI